MDGRERVKRRHLIPQARSACSHRCASLRRGVQPASVPRLAQPLFYCFSFFPFFLFSFFPSLSLPAFLRLVGCCTSQPLPTCVFLIASERARSWFRLAKRQNEGSSANGQLPLPLRPPVTTACRPPPSLDNPTNLPPPVGTRSFGGVFFSRQPLFLPSSLGRNELRRRAADATATEIEAAREPGRRGRPESVWLAPWPLRSHQHRSASKSFGSQAVGAHTGTRHSLAGPIHPRSRLVS